MVHSPYALKGPVGFLLTGPVSALLEIWTLLRSALDAFGLPSLWYQLGGPPL